MRYMRIFGDNVAYLLRRRSETGFADAFGFSADDVARIKEGRIILCPQDINAIAEYLGTPWELLFEEHPEYSQVHVFGECSTDAKNQILDLIDLYCDLAEAVR